MLVCHTPHSKPVLVWIDGKIFPASAPALPALDQAYLSGTGAFETIRAEGGAPLFLSAHFARLAASAALFNLEVLDIGVVRDGINQLLERQGLECARIRLTVSHLQDADGVPFRFGGKTRTSLLAFPLGLATSRPLRLVTAPFRLDSASPLAGHKCTSYALHALAVGHARAAGCDDALMLDHRGHLTGCATGNIFWAKNGTLHTPDIRCGCRNGVTRERVIKACERLEIPCMSTRAKAATLMNSDEVFTTSSIRGVRSVIRVDGNKLNPGGLARRIRNALRRDTLAEILRS